MNHFLIYNHNILFLKNGKPLNSCYSILFKSEKVDLIELNESTFFILGDFLSSKCKLENFTLNSIKELKGNFYIIQTKNQNISIINSLFSILPIYYTSNFNIICSDLNWLKESCNSILSFDKKFILECLIFNFGFSNRTLFKNVFLVPCNTLISINNENCSLIKHFEIEQVINTKKETINEKDLSELFLRTSLNYFPEESFHIAFTGGFDGRTLVSCATFFKKKFTTFSFGKTKNDDVSIPKKNAKQIGIPYRHFDLGQYSYINDFFIENALEYIKESNGGNGYIYSHFLYTTKELAKETNYILAGYFGSELFRALHIPGAVSSETLINVFKSNSPEEIRSQLFKSKALRFINEQEFETELTELAEEVVDYIRNISFKDNQNARLYVFVFEEIFRKFFGQWIVAQQKYITVRTPFLDYEFISQLLKTKFAGVNADFLTKNPYKRMNGQIIYAHIIKKSNKTLFYQKTGKGYRPVDIINKWFFPNIVSSYIYKIIRKKTKKENLDNLGIISGVKNLNLQFKQNKYFSSLFKTTELQNSIDNLNEFTAEHIRDNCLMIASLYSLLKEKDLQKENS
jgi:hypothetical protein